MTQTARTDDRHDANDANNPNNPNDRTDQAEVVVESARQPGGGVSRRRLLVGASAAAGGGLLLAACGGSSDDKSAVAGDATTANATSADPTTTAAPQATTTTQSAPGAQTSAAGAGTVVAALSPIPVGGAISAKGKGNAKILVCQPSAGKVVAFSAICTHEGCTVAPAKKSLDCPCHGSKYDIATGKVLAGPAPRPLPAVHVAVDGKNVVQS